MNKIPKLLLRIAAGLILFFAIGHSIGHFTRHEVNDPKAQEILKIISENKFKMFDQMRSYDENYTGMSLNLIFTLLTFTILLLIISNNKSLKPKEFIKFLVPILLCVLGFAITGLMYFFMVPAITCILAFLLIGASIILILREE